MFRNHRNFPLAFVFQESRIAPIKAVVAFKWRWSMGRIDFFLGVVLLSLFLAAGAPGVRYVVASESAFALTGSVVSDGSDEPIVQARVVLCDDGGNPLEEMFTNQSGNFSFQGLRPAHYTLRVQAQGYQDAETNVDLSLASERGFAVTLKPVRADTPSKPGEQTISVHELAMPKTARNLLVSGKKKLYAEKNAQAALRDFQSAIKQAPTFYEAYYQAGMAYLALQNSSEAEKQFQKSVEISEKKYADADIALGTLLLHRGQGHEGESLLRLGVAGDPGSWPGQVELGELELSQGHLELAQTAAERAVQLAPQQPFVYRLLAVIQLKEKNYGALVSTLDSYIQLDPDSPAGVRAKELRAQAQKELANSPSAAVAVK
jgi:Flp pilus assembly protein TadD